MLRRKRNSLTSGNCTLRDGKEPMVFWAKRWSALEGEQLDEWQLYVEGRERAYGFLGEEMVWLFCVGRGTASRVAIVRCGAGKKLWYVCWAKRWSALEGEQLDEWQLYVEGRERSYGTCVGRRDGLRWKGNSWTSGNCRLRGGKEAMVRLLGYEMVGLCCVGRGTASRVAIVRWGTGKRLLVW
jgi:hypothetical protein